MAMRPIVEPDPERRYDRSRGDPDGRWARSWALLSAAWPVVRDTRPLWWLGLATIACGLASGALFLLLSHGAYRGGELRMFALLLALDVPTRIVTSFFGVAMCLCAQRAFAGERATVRAALRGAWRLRGPIVGWSLIASLVGRLIQGISRRVPFGGWLISWLGGIAWEAASYLALAVIATHGTGPRETLRRSAGAIRERFGEGAAGVIRVTAGTVVVSVPAGICLGVGFGFLAAGATIPAVVALSVGGVGLLLVWSLSVLFEQVFALSLLRYAETGVADGPFAAHDLDASIRRSRRGNVRRTSR